MELFGLILSIPGAFLASVLYRYLLLIALSRWPRIAPVLNVASWFVLAVILVEWVLLLLRGAVETRMLVGPVFYPAHLITFVLGTPALINVLILPCPTARWFRTVPLATVLAFILVVQQYAVFEALYGIDGEDGRFSEVDPH